MRGKMQKRRKMKPMVKNRWTLRFGNVDFSMRTFSTRSEAITYRKEAQVPSGTPVRVEIREVDPKR